MFVYVLDINGKPLMPTNRSGKVRRMLRDKKAKVVKRCPFTIQLLYETKTHIVQECVLGVDTGSKYVGASVISNGKVLYQSEIELRTDIKGKMDSRRSMRRNRRHRKTRYRKARFLNRGNSIKKTRYSPTVKNKFDSHIKEIEYVKSILPISKLVLETAKFDTQLMENPHLQKHKWAYQKGINYGFANARAHALERDGYTCQVCGKSHTRLEVHHIIWRSQNGSNELDNLIALCENCHSDIHSGKTTLKVKGKYKRGLNHSTQMSTIRCMLLSEYPKAKETFGFITKANAEHLGIEKQHYLDACVIASAGNQFEQSDWLFRKKCVSKQDRQLCKGVRGEKTIPTGKIFGFRKFDLVKYLKNNYFIKGRMSSGYAILMDIFGNKINFSHLPRGWKTPKLSNLERLTTRKSVLCTNQKIIASIV